MSILDYGRIGAAAILLVYALWQLGNSWRWWRSNRPGPEPPAANARSTVAVLIPFRNERTNLPELLAALRAQTYPPALTEFLFVDDHSTDGGAEWLTAATAGDARFRLLRLADALGDRRVIAHKKAALTYAIDSTVADHLVTTDADCDWPPDRLAELVAALDRYPVVLGPVAIGPAGHDLSSAFQALDLYAYQFLTAVSTWRGRPLLANGACFGFRRSAFTEVGGYAGVDQLPSGDDVLLLHKFRERLPAGAFHWLGVRRPVVTRPVAGWRALWQQRLRWAGKAGHYRDVRLDVAQGLTFAANLALLLLTLLWPLHTDGWLTAGGWATKLLVDGLALGQVTRYYGDGRLLRWYPVVAVVYPVFLVAVGVAALLGVRPDWKGRSTAASPAAGS